MNARFGKVTLLVVVGVAATALGTAGASGCGGESASGVAGARLPEGVRSESIEHESCDESGHRVEVLDANNDGKPDVKRVYDNKTGKEVCRITDLNHDGKPDMFEYYDANGQLRRREADYDDSGVVDAIEYFDNGRLARRELDTTGQHRIDTWDYFDPATGKRVRRERDSTNDGRVDQWWTWNGDVVTIAIDKNGTGKPDPSATVVIGANGQVIEDAGGPPGPPAPPGAEGALDAGVASLNLPPAQPQPAPELDAGAPPTTTDGGTTAAIPGDGGAGPLTKGGAAKGGGAGTKGTNKGGGKK